MQPKFYLNQEVYYLFGHEVRLAKITKIVRAQNEIEYYSNGRRLKEASFVKEEVEEARLQ